MTRRASRYDRPKPADWQGFRVTDAIFDGSEPAWIAPPLTLHLHALKTVYGCEYIATNLIPNAGFCHLIAKPGVLRVNHDTGRIERLS